LDLCFCFMAAVVLSRWQIWNKVKVQVEWCCIRKFFFCRFTDKSDQIRRCQKLDMCGHTLSIIRRMKNCVYVAHIVVKCSFQILRYCWNVDICAFSQDLHLRTILRSVNSRRWLDLAGKSRHQD
jgi:hypothetical protein